MTRFLYRFVATGFILTWLLWLIAWQVHFWSITPLAR